MAFVPNVLTDIITLMEAVCLCQIFANPGVIKVELAHNAMMDIFLMAVNAKGGANL